MSGPRVSLLAVAWAGFQGRTAALAEAFDGRAVFVNSRLRGVPALLPLRYLGCAVRTWALLERERPKRVVVVTPPVLAPLVVWSWCWLRRRPLVIDCHTDMLHSRKWRWARPIHRWLLRRCRAALLHTEEALQEVEPWRVPGLLLPDDVPDLDDASPRHLAPRTTVLVAGSMDGNEPVAEALAAAALLPDVEVRFTGDPGQLPAAMRGSASPNVVFTGFLPYREFLGEMLAAHVVAVFSTDPHIMNRAAFEAVGMGRPLVLSDLALLRARFGQAAVFAAGQPEAMAKALRAALADQVESVARTQALVQVLRRQRERAMEQLRGMVGEPAAKLPGRVLRVSQHPLSENVLIRRDLDELLSQGYQVDLICSAGAADDRLPPPPAGLQVYRIPIRHRRRPAIRYPLEYSAFFLAAFAVVSALGLRHRYAAVEVDNLPDTLVFAAVVPRLRGARVVFNMYELTPNMVAARFRGVAGPALVRLARMLEYAAIRWAHHVIVVSQPCFDVLQARGVPAAKMSVVLNTQVWTAVPPRSTADGANSRPPVLVTHSTLLKRYGVDVAIQALDLLRSRWPELTLMVVGDGEHRPALAELAQRLGVSDRVTFKGFLPWSQTVAEVSKATLGIVAVMPDGYGQLLLPTKLLEYARLGLPVACSRLPAIEAYFSPDSLGYFTPGDPRALAEQIDHLLRDPELAALQAGRAAEIARRMDWDRVRFDFLSALGLPAGREARTFEVAPKPHSALAGP